MRGQNDPARGISLKLFHARWTLRLLAFLLIAGAPATLPQSPLPAANGSGLLLQGNREEALGRFPAALGDYESALRSNPGNAQLALRIGLLEGEEGDFVDAVAAFKRAVQIQPNFAEAHYNLGLALVANSPNGPIWTEALIQFRAALASRPDYSQAANMAGVCLLKSGDISAAISQLKDAVKEDPRSAEAHFNLGRALETSGETASAYAEYLAALKDKSPFPEAESALGNLLLGRKEAQPAIEYLKAAVSANPDDEQTRYLLARAFRAAGNTAAATEELQQAAMLLQKHSDSIKSSHLSNESLNQAKAGDLRGAVDLARKALWLNPENADANFNLGLLIADAGNLQASILEIRKAISLAPLNVRMYVDFSRVLEKDAEPCAALDSLRKARMMDPSDQNLQGRIEALDARVHCQSSPRAASQGQNRFFFGAPSDTTDSHLEFAMQLIKEGDFLGSIGELQRALALQPRRSDVRYTLAVTEVQIGQSDRAELELKTVLLESPGSVDAHLALGSLLFERKDFANAEVELRRALTLQPSNRQAALLLKNCQIATAN